MHVQITLYSMRLLIVIVILIRLDMLMLSRVHRPAHTILRCPLSLLTPCRPDCRCELRDPTSITDKDR